MPTEMEFLMARDAFRAAAETVRVPVGPMVCAIGPTVLVGGRLTGDTQTCVDDSATGMRAVAEGCERLADECDWRARVCAAAYAAQAAYDRAHDSYVDDYRHWESERNGDEPSPPHRPPPPPPWVEWR